MILKWLSSIFKKSSSQTTPERVVIKGDERRYRPAVEAGFWSAARRVSKYGYKVVYEIAVVEVVISGLVKSSGGEYGFMEPGFARPMLGTCDGYRIKIAVDNRGNIYEKAMEHEWGHAFLYANKFVGDQEKELKRMGFAI